MGNRIIDLSGNSFKNLDLVQSIGKDIYDNSPNLSVGGVIDIPEFIGGGACFWSSLVLVHGPLSCTGVNVRQFHLCFGSAPSKAVNMLVSSWACCRQ